MALATMSPSSVMRRRSAREAPLGNTARATMAPTGKPRKPRSAADGKGVALPRASS